MGLVNYPILVLWEDRNGELWPSEVHQLMLPPEFVEPPAAWQNTGGKIKREFKILPSVDQTKLAVVGDSTALIDLGKVAIVGDFRTPNIVGFSADGKRLLALDLNGQLELWDVVTGRQLPQLYIFRRSVDFLRTLQTRYSLKEEANSLYRFDPATATFYVIKYDEKRDPMPRNPKSTTERTTVQSFYVLGRLCLQAP